MVRTTRIKTYSPGDIVSATDLNAIQDHIADTAHVVNRLATMSNAASVWVDRTGDEGSATVYPVVDQGFVKMQAGGQRGRLMLPGVPDGLTLQEVRIRCHIPDAVVAFTLWQTIASAAEGPTLQHRDSQVPGWPEVAWRGVGWVTIAMTGPAVGPDARTVFWVLVENRHEPLNEWRSLILSSVQGVWG